MNDKEQILLAIKTQVTELLPAADVILFGSRANDSATEESDWDILVLTNGTTISPVLKKDMHNKIFPLSVSIGAFINIILVTKKDWQQNPSFYSIKKTIALNNRLL